MKANDTSRWPVDELWELYQEVGALLHDRLASELQRRISVFENLSPTPCCIPKPAARAKASFVNPSNPSQTWSGRGRMPDWLTQAWLWGAVWKTINSWPETFRHSDNGGFLSGWLHLPLRDKRKGPQLNSRGPRWAEVSHFSGGRCDMDQPTSFSEMPTSESTSGSGAWSCSERFVWTKLNRRSSAADTQVGLGGFHWSIACST